MHRFCYSTSPISCLYSKFNHGECSPNVFIEPANISEGVASRFGVVPSDLDLDDFGVLGGAHAAGNSLSVQAMNDAAGPYALCLLSSRTVVRASATIRRDPSVLTRATTGAAAAN